MTVLEVIKENYAKVKGDDNIMWATTGLISDALEPMRETHPEEYWMLIRSLYCTMCKPHYNENFAMYDVSEMWHKSKLGVIEKGQHWSMGETDALYDKMKSKFPATYNKYDWYVTMNMLYHDNICLYKEWWSEANEDILAIKMAESAANYLADMDAEDGKIWNYINAKSICHS